MKKAILSVFILIMMSGYALASSMHVVTVSKHIDGDTIQVRDSQNRFFKVRFIGVDTPETRHPKKGVEYYGKEAAAFTKKQLPLGKKVYLEKDVSETDRYGRLLRYVWLAKPSDSGRESEIRGKMLNAVLLLDGYARNATYPPDVRHSKLFAKYAREARAHSKGLWRK